MGHRPMNYPESHELPVILTSPKLAIAIGAYKYDDVQNIRFLDISQSQQGVGHNKVDSNSLVGHNACQLIAWELEIGIWVSLTWHPRPMLENWQAWLRRTDWAVIEIDIQQHITPEQNCNQSNGLVGDLVLRHHTYSTPCPHNLDLAWEWITRA